MHLELSPCVLQACVLNHTTDFSLDFILAAITVCVHTVQSHCVTRQSSCRTLDNGFCAFGNV